MCIKGPMWQEKKLCLLALKQGKDCAFRVSESSIEVKEALYVLRLMYCEGCLSPFVYWINVHIRKMKLIYFLHDRLIIF